MSSAFEGLPKTPNLELNKPGYDNVADIEALNENADILDAEIQGIKNTFVKSVNGINAGDDGNVDLGIIPISEGGTGANNASQACANIGALPLSGGTMTGAIVFDGASLEQETAIMGNDTTSRVAICSAGIHNYGGKCAFYGKDHATAAGQIVLTPSLSSDKEYSFILDPSNREIAWDGEEVPSIAYKDIKFNAVNQQNVIRYRNGLQIITGEINYSDLTNGVLTFVLPFLNNNITVLVSATWGDGSNVPKITAFPTTSTQTTIRVSEPCYFKLLTIGRWK